MLYLLDVFFSSCDWKPRFVLHWVARASQSLHTFYLLTLIYSQNFFYRFGQIGMTSELNTLHSPLSKLVWRISMWYKFIFHFMEGIKWKLKRLLFSDFAICIKCSVIFSWQVFNFRHCYIKNLDNKWNKKEFRKKSLSMSLVEVVTERRPIVMLLKQTL